MPYNLLIQHYIFILIEFSLDNSCRLIFVPEAGFEPAQPVKAEGFSSRVCRFYSDYVLSILEMLQLILIPSHKDTNFIRFLSLIVATNISIKIISNLGCGCIVSTRL